MSQTVGLTDRDKEDGVWGWSVELATRARREAESGRAMGLKVMAALNLERISLPNRGRGHWGITKNL